MKIDTVSYATDNITFRTKSAKSITIRYDNGDLIIGRGCQFKKYVNPDNEYIMVETEEKGRFDRKEIEILVYEYREYEPIESYRGTVFAIGASPSRGLIDITTARGTKSYNAEETFFLVREV